MAVSDCTQKEIEKMYHQSAVATGVGRSADALTALKRSEQGHADRGFYQQPPHFKY